MKLWISQKCVHYYVFIFYVVLCVLSTHKYYICVVCVKVNESSFFVHSGWGGGAWTVHGGHEVGR